MTTPASVPADLGYRMPAEWEPHQATWLSWPHNRASWPGKFETVEPVMCTAVRALCRSEPVYINVLDTAHEAHVRTRLGTLGTSAELRFYHFPTNDAWCRDHGAILVRRQRDGRPELAAVHCDYNAWGGKYPPYDLDQQIPVRMAAALAVPRFVGGLVLEGGSIDVNGAGMLLTTEQCLLNVNRNPHLTRTAIEQRLRDLFGIEKILWLGDGIVGDDTDGHIDDLARFVSTDTIVTVIEDDPADANHQALVENLRRLRAFTDQHGETLQVLTLPLPHAVEYEGQRLPASYANFYIANTVVLLPVFNDPNDRIAIEALSACFPTREIVPIDCTDLVWGLGAFHCLTQQVPASG
jgi:agmatine deiminase